MNDPNIHAIGCLLPEPEDVVANDIDVKTSNERNSELRNSWRLSLNVRG
jgi:hypothetical protein